VAGSDRRRSIGKEKQNAVKGVLEL
jgi:hypothetical protein